MRLNLKQIGAHGGDSLEFQTTLDLSAARRWGEQPVPGPVAVTGTVKGQNGVYTLAGAARFEHAARCARCLEDIRRQTEIKFTHIVAEEIADESACEFVSAPDGVLELDELICADILLELEENPLCSPDCRGLCPVCGRNRNLADCGCAAKKPDPRFEKLRELMRQQQSPTD